MLVLSNLITDILDFTTHNTVIGGLIGGAIVLLVSWLVPRLSEKIWNRYLPEVYMIVPRTNFFKIDSTVSNSRFGIVLRVENNTDSPLTFSTPEFFVRKNSRHNFFNPQWESTNIVVPPFTIADLEKAPITYNIVISEGYPKCRYHLRNIRIDAHDLLDEYVVFDLGNTPTIYSWRFVLRLTPPVKVSLEKGSWVLGKIVIKPVGSKPISKTIYLDRNNF